MNVYIVRIERSSRFYGNNICVDRAYTSEEKAWKRIEQQVNELVNTLKKINDVEIWFSEFRGKSFVLAYNTLYGAEYNRYYIDKLSVE